MPREELQLFTKADVENARTKGQVIGWAQGAGAVVLVMVGISLIGWIPMIVVGGAAVYLLARALSK